jgi:hypothetical protein
VSSYGQNAVSGSALSSKPSVAFDRQVVSEIRTADLPETEQKLIAKMPVSFHHFGAARVGETAELQELTIRFEKTTKLTEIKATADFKVEEGGSCVEGNVYEAKSTCKLLVRFHSPRCGAPSGQTHRLSRYRF